MEKKFYTIRELAELISASEIWVKRRVRTGEIPSYKIGGKRLFKREEIEKWIDSQKDETKAATR